MGLFERFISLFKKKDSEGIDKSVSHIETGSLSTSENEIQNSTEKSTDKGKVDEKHPDNSIDAIRIAEEERRKKEWLEFLRTKRAKRRKELEEELIILDKQLEYIQQRIISIKEERKELKKHNNPDINFSKQEVNPISVNEFSFPPLEKLTSMREYQEQRIEEERRVREDAENTIINSIAKIRKLLSDRNIHEAVATLNIISQKIAFVEDQELRDKVKEIVLSITELRIQLDEERRAKEEEQRKKKALEAKLRAEAQERLREEKEKLRKKEEEEKRERARKYQEELKAKEEAERREINSLESLSKVKKSDSVEIEYFLRKNGIKFLYHFTEASNIPLIKSRKGLYSWSYLESHGMRIPFAGGDTLSRGLDRDKGLEDYVRLSFYRSHPMAYRIHKEQKGNVRLVLLKIKLDAALFESTLYSDINAADSNARTGNDLQFIEDSLDVNAVKLDWCYSNTPEHKKRQAEVLVKTFLPAKYIVNLDNPEEMIFNN